MRPSISIWIALVLFFGLLSVAELCYLRWWKRKRNESGAREEGTNVVGRWLLCWRKPSPVHDKVSGWSEEKMDRDLEMGYGLSVDLEVKSFAEEGVEAELMRIHNLCGPPRFLFTIEEETVEDLASEDGNPTKARTRLIDLMRDSDADFLSPVKRSPSSLTGSPFRGSNGLFNPLFESSGEAELINRLRPSPPPKFKFSRDAEEKLCRRNLQEEAQRGLNSSGRQGQMKPPRSCSSELVPVQNVHVRQVIN